MRNQSLEVLLAQKAAAEQEFNNLPASAREIAGKLLERVTDPNVAPTLSRDRNTCNGAKLAKKALREKTQGAFSYVH